METHAQAAMAIAIAYLALFFWGGVLAARAAGRPIWLFSRARGSGQLAAIGFRLSFILPFATPILSWAWPPLAAADPVAAAGLDAGVIGILLAAGGSMLAFAAQMSMGASWRVGVIQGETGTLVSDGLYRFSRNPTFVGQFLMLAGIALAAPSLPSLTAPLMFLWSASTQVRVEEQVLRRSWGRPYDEYCRRVPRWLGRGTGQG